MRNAGEEATFKAVGMKYLTEFALGVADGFEQKPMRELGEKAAQANYEIARLCGVTARVHKIALVPCTPANARNGKLEHWLSYVSSLGGVHSVPRWQRKPPRPKWLREAAFSLEDLGL